MDQTDVACTLLSTPEEFYPISPKRQIMPTKVVSYLPAGLDSGDIYFRIISVEQFSTFETS